MKKLLLAVLFLFLAEAAYSQCVAGTTRDATWDGVYDFDIASTFIGPFYLWREDPSTAAEEGTAYFWFRSETVTGGPYSSSRTVTTDLSGITLSQAARSSDALTAYPVVTASVGTGGAGLLIKATTSASATLGAGTITFTTVSGGVTQTVCHPIFVKDVTAPDDPDLGTLTFPDIPGLDEWEASMVGADGGLKFDETSEQTPTSENGVWYYDGIRAYYQLETYTSDSQWATAARVVRDDAYLIQLGYPPSCGVQGYRVFTTGLRLDYEATGSTNSYNALTCLADQDPYGGDIRTGNQRATAYQLLAYIDAEKVGYTITKPWRKHKATAMLLAGLDWQLTQGHNSEAANDMQPFFIGLMVEALIASYEWDVAEAITPDYRIPEMVQEAAGLLWTAAWLSEFQTMKYSMLEPLGAQGNSPSNILNNLIAPMYAWLYLRYGDSTDRDRADDLFAGSSAVINSPQDFFHGKGFAQNYRWSFDYVAWRQSSPATVPPSPPSTKTNVTRLTATGRLTIESDPEPVGQCKIRLNDRKHFFSITDIGTFTRSFRATNTGTAGCTLQSTSITDDDGTLAVTGPSTLAVGETGTYTITWTPTSTTVLPEKYLIDLTWIDS